MKKRKIATVGLTLSLALSAVLSVVPVGSASVKAAPVSGVEVYRLYNVSTGEHLYTTDSNEVSVLSGTSAWNYEGIGWYAPESGDAVYRLNNAKRGEHLYTTDSNEVATLTAEGGGWQLDNDGNPVFYSGGDVAVYRLYNPKLAAAHLLTVDEGEYNTLGANGWQQEGRKLDCLEVGSSSAPAPAVETTTETAAAETASTETAATETVSTETTATETASTEAAATTTTAGDYDYDPENLPGDYAIEADVTLSGSGGGYHAKLLIANWDTLDSAISFGLQYDAFTKSEFASEAAYIFENIKSNAPGQQEYYQYKGGSRNTTYKILLSMSNDGTITAYVNYKKIGSVSNPSLVGHKLYFSVEGSGRKNGDSVTASFANIRFKSPVAINHTDIQVRNAGLSVDAPSLENITISGTVTGLADNQDWDNAYNDVSGVVNFVHWDNP